MSTAFVSASTLVETSTATQTIEDVRPWVERYRPQSLREIAHQPEAVATLLNAVETGRLPHLLLYGPPGSGKVSEYARE
jgi:replication factor C subunit 2/4